MNLNESPCPRFFTPNSMTTPIAPHRSPLRQSLECFWFLPVLLLFFGLRSSAQQNSPSAPGNPVSQTPYTEVSRGPHSRVMQRTSTWTNAAGKTITRINSYNEIATGLSHLVNNQWIPSSDQ